jgi:hypothetical protein
MCFAYNNREDCIMRHENGNCLPCGGFCLAVNNEICYALQLSYNKGFNAGYYKCWQELYTIGTTDISFDEES